MGTKTHRAKVIGLKTMQGVVAAAGAGAGPPTGSTLLGAMVNGTERLPSGGRYHPCLELPLSASLLSILGLPPTVTMSSIWAESGLHHARSLYRTRRTLQAEP